jgi:uncharacterized protein YdbL (DUF1318 family)
MKVTLFKTLPLMLAALLFSMTSWALELDDAKAKGLVGEQVNGYLGLVKADNMEAAALVVDINRQRKVKYQEIANKQNTQLANIEKIAGEKLVEKASEDGFYYLNSTGGWER